MRQENFNDQFGVSYEVVFNTELAQTYPKPVTGHYCLHVT